MLVGWSQSRRQGIDIVSLIEEPRGKPRGIFDRKEFCLFLIRPLTPQQAAENALAIAVHDLIFGKLFACN